MYTKLFTRYAIAAGIAGALLFSACPTSGGPAGEETPPHNAGGGESGFVVFDNTAGLCPARVYQSNRRAPDELVCEVARGAASAPLAYPPSPHGAAFYFSYTTFIDDVPLVYVPSAPAGGVGSVRVDAGKTATIPVPPVDEGLASVSTPLAHGAYLVVRNASACAFYLVKGSVIVKPENYKAADALADSETSYIVNNGEAAVYVLSGGDGGQTYKLNLTTGQTHALGGVVPTFEDGVIYEIILRGESTATFTPELKSEKPITLANVSMAEGANKDFSFTTWRDGSGDNTIEFYASSARLDGAYWKHPDGSYNYAGQILEAQYRDDLQAMIIWTKRTASKGFRLEKDEGGALLLHGAPVRHPFFEMK